MLRKEKNEPFSVLIKKHKQRTKNAFVKILLFLFHLILLSFSYFSSIILSNLLFPLSRYLIQSVLAEPIRNSEEFQKAILSYHAKSATSWDFSGVRKENQKKKSRKIVLILFSFFFIVT